MNERRILGILLLALLLAACGTDDGSGTAGGEGRLQAVATTGMIADVVRQVGGEHVDVTQLMGAGVDPHLYRASEGDVERLTRADVIFYNGFFLEAGMERVLLQMDERSGTTVPVAESTPEERRIDSVIYEGLNDPHIWMDVKLWINTIDMIRDTLIEMDPENADAYRANAERYRAEMEALEAYVVERLAEVPPERRLLVTAHDAFNYFSTGYDFEVFAPQGISTQSEASTADIRATIDVVVSREVPAIFVESTISPDVVEAVQEGARSRGHEVRIGGELFTDAMGSPDSEAGTYLGMIRHNVDTIVDALK